MFVTGCHRSGTSLVASVFSAILSRLSPDSSVAALGSRSDLPHSIDNPRGFFESRQLRMFNDHLLELAGCRWDRPPLLAVDWSNVLTQEFLEQARADFRLQSLDFHWVDKDPRLALTFSAWRHVLLRRVPLVCVLRGPLEVAASLQSRNSWDLNRGLALWFLYNHHLSHLLQANDFLLCYENVLQSRLGRTDQEFPFRLCSWLNEQSLPSCTPQLCQDVIHQMIDPSLQRSASIVDQNFLTLHVHETLLELCSSSYLSVSTSDSPISSYKKAFQDLPAQLLQYFTTRSLDLGVGPIAQSQLESLSSTLHAERQRHDQQRLASDTQFKAHLEDHRALIKDQQLKITELERLLQVAELQLAALYASFSWRATAPIRRLTRLIRQGR